MTCKMMMCSLLGDDRTVIVLILLSIVYIHSGIRFFVRMMCVLCVHGWKTGYLDTRQHKHHKAQQSQTGEDIYSTGRSHT